MTAPKGVLTIAYGKRRYVRQAVNLARSIRLCDRCLPLAVATDFPPSAFAGLDDSVVPWDFSQWPEFLSKLELYAITPFDSIIRLSAYAKWFYTVGFAEYCASTASRLEKKLRLRPHLTKSFK